LPISEFVNELSGCAPAEPDGPLKITGELNIRTLDQLHQTLTRHLGRGQDLVVDLSGVPECDTAALQLFCALSKSGFDIVAVSPAIREIAAGVGLRVEDIGGRSDARGIDGGI
jgi:anti-anti-sigma regulatory factor